MFFRSIRTSHILCSAGQLSCTCLCLTMLKNVLVRTCSGKKASCEMMISFSMFMYNTVMHHLTLKHKQVLVHLHMVLRSVLDCHAERDQMHKFCSEKHTILESQSLQETSMLFCLALLMLCFQYTEHKTCVIMLIIYYSLFKLDLRRSCHRAA
jgi:hypothetical protein